MLNEDERDFWPANIFWEFANIFCKKFVKMLSTLLHLPESRYLINEKKTINPDYLFMHGCIVFQNSVCRKKF